MKGFDILHVKSAVKSLNQFDLSKNHLTTMDFGQIVPLYVEETIPRDKFQISADYFSRMAPLVKPTFGKFSFKTVTAFVPYHQIAWDCDAWLAGKTSWEGVTPHHRFFTVLDFHNFIISTNISSLASGEMVHDYAYTDASGTARRRKFTKRGRYYMKILNALGYNAPENVDVQPSSEWMTNESSVHLSAYPLIAFCKLYNDYMSQSQRYNSSSLSSILQNLKYGKAFSGYTVATGQMTSAVVYSLLQNILLNYENDYFSTAWQNENRPLENPDSINQVDVPGSNAPITYGVQDTNLTLNTFNEGEQVNIPQRALDFLRSFDDWVRRNNYSGSRAVQQVYSRFGIKTDEYKSHYAHVYSTDSMPVQVGDVTATASTSDAVLGEYSGKGIMSGNNRVSIEVNDYGIIFILGYFTVIPMNSFGSDRRVLRSNPLDYYNPEFDGLGADAISVGELWQSPVSTEQSGVFDSDVFGFTERYNAYRFGRDVITGDFRNYYANGDMNVWHTGRNLEALRVVGALVAQSSSFNTLPQVDSEYNRLFSVTDSQVDHFYLTARFSVSAIRPILNLNQVPRLGEGDTTVPRNGNVIS